MQCTSTLPFTVLALIFGLVFLFVSGSGNVCDDEDPKDKNKCKVIPHTESGDTGKFGQENEPCCGWTQLWCK
jgi:hypothetical protein